MMGERIAKYFRARWPRAYFWGPAIVLAAAIFRESSRSDTALPDWGFSYADKSAHVAAYWVLGFLVCRGIGFGRRATAKMLAWGCLLTALYGGMDEIHQHFVPGRACELSDWIADFAGAALGAATWWAVGMRVRRGQRQKSEV
jgi:VanZ family protein